MRTRREVVRSDGRRYESTAAAANDVAGDQTNISRACRNRKLTAYGYGWHYADEEEES